MHDINDPEQLGDSGEAAGGAGPVESVGPAQPVMPLEPLPPIASRFLYVDVAALRAKQLRRGAKVRYASGEGGPVAHKPERVAMEEVRRGLVYYEVVPERKGSEGAEA